MDFTHIDVPQSTVFERMMSRTLTQFHHSPVFQDIVRAFATEIQALLDAIHDVIQYRTPGDAYGEQLDAVGRIIGWSRNDGFAPINWFTPDAYGLGCDTVAAWVEGGDLLTQYNLADNLYRKRLQAKVFRNFCQYGSVTDIQDYVQIAFGVPCSVVRVGPMECEIWVPIGTPDYVITLMTDFGDNRLVEDTIRFPYPATLSITIVLKPLVTLTGIGMVVDGELTSIQGA